MTKNFKLRAFAIFFLFLLSIISASAEVIDIDNTLLQLQPGDRAYYLEDKTGRLSFQDVQKDENTNHWKRSKKYNLGFGFTNSAFWVKFTVRNITSREIEFYLLQDYPHSDILNLYVQFEKNKVISFETGDTKPFSERPYEYRNFVFPIKLAGKSTATCFVQQKSSGPMNFVLAIWSPEAFKKASSREYYLLMIFYGIMMVMCVYNLFVFISVRRFEYLFYVISIGLVLSFLMMLDGTAFQFLWPDSPWITNLLIPMNILLAAFFAVLFNLVYLSDIKLAPSIHRQMIIIAAVDFTAFIVCFFITYGQGIILSASLVGISIAHAFFSAVILALKRHRPAYFWLFSILVFSIGCIVYVLMLFRFLPVNFFTEWSIQIGSAATVVLFSMALADRINTMRKELTILNEHLEDKVKERTEELQAATQELEAMNESLFTINEQLTEAQRIASLDMIMAVNVQKALLPKSPPSSKEWDSAFVYKSMAGVSGDFYDFYLIENEFKGVLLMDVSGHGISSGLVTMVARSVFFRNFKNGLSDNLGMVLQAANQELINEIGETDKYLTGIILRFKDDIVEYVNAAHTDLLYRKNNRKNVLPVKDKEKDFKGMFLGFSDTAGTYDQIKFKVSRGDVLLLYTDCLIESKNSNGEEYGTEKLTVSLEKAPDTSAMEILNYLMKDFKEFIGETPTTDDLTIIILKRSA